MVTPFSRLRRLVTAAGLSIAAAAAAFALPVPTSSEACPAVDPPATQARAAGEAGIRVFVDPATGRIRRATPEDRQRLAMKTSRDRSGRTYEVRTRQDGTRIVKLDETFSMGVVAHANADGTISYRCVTEPVSEATVAETEQ